MKTCIQAFMLVELLVVIAIITIRYPLSFADGHVEAFKSLCQDTINWAPGLPIPGKNQDLINLRNAAYFAR